MSHSSKHHAEIKEKELEENKYPNDAQENANIKLLEMMSTNQDLLMKFSKEVVETLKRTQGDMMLELNNPNNLTTNSKESLQEEWIKQMMKYQD